MPRAGLMRRRAISAQPDLANALRRISQVIVLSSFNPIIQIASRHLLLRKKIA
jgi:hypothetical protein